MLRILYSLITVIAIPIWVARLLILSLRYPERRYRLRERFAFGLPRANAQQGPIWVHAVSVGEVAAAEPLIKALLDAEADTQVLLTTMTPTGSARAQLIASDRLLHCYLPYDLPVFIRRFIRTLRPRLLVVMETELWPNLLAVCAQESVPTLLANGRLSARSAKRYAIAARFTQQMLGSLSQLCAQSVQDAERFIALGAPLDKVTVTGSLKFHIGAPASQEEFETGIFAALRESERPILIAASTRAQEEDKVLNAFKRMLEQKADLLLLLVPRHAERFDEVAQLCEKRGFTWQRRSRDEAAHHSTQIVLGDSMYELARYYACADVAFVGGSLVDTGCQNVLEPAALGKPIVTGPSQFNFKAICELLESEGALLTVPDEEALAEAVLELLNSDARRQAMGEAARALIANNQQALPEHLRLIRSLLA